MIASDLQDNLMQKIYDRAAIIIEERAKTLKAMLKYEIAVTNTELAMRSNEHGYDKKFLSDSYADNILLSPVQTESGCVSMTLSIPRHAYKNASDKEVEFFKEYVLANAVQRLRRGS